MASAGKKVLVIDARPHVAGNAFDERNEHDILVPRYGPHVFHTNSSAVWSYLSRFTQWRQYEHRVLGHVKDQLVPIPFNLTSLKMLFTPDVAARVEALLVSSYGLGSRVPILKLLNSGNSAAREFAAFVYENVYVGYTFKQWGLRPEDLDPAVTARVPIRISQDSRYFLDTYQAMPAKGYTAMFNRMLAHPNIALELNCGWSDICKNSPAEGILYTGALDELLDHQFGALPYRSCRFEQQTTTQATLQPAGTINYTNTEKFTRVTEQKILTGQTSTMTTLIIEYPQPHQIGRTTAYYPVPRQENDRLYRRYLAAARSAYPKMHFSGRLADYQYYNMDQACARALSMATSCGADIAKHSASQHAESSFSEPL
jgi:UDP-galactopyranose mutase